jgi:2-keto-4-pentenoate hydratase/2-oxohepta-3-ene-1,7-dioic acid hydratase in catechol pathway
MKPDTTIIGPGETVLLPKLSNRVTGEAELGLVFGAQCRDVARDAWSSVLAGYTTIVDMTAEDILRRNPRNLTQCKSFDTFLSIGPVLVTPDEVADISKVRVRTVHNGKVHAENTIDRMTFPPDYLVWYHTQIMTFLPGDILSSGTPGAAVLAEGDTIACEIDGFPTLTNPVHDLKA